MTPEAPLSVETTGHLGVVTLRRPEARNAISPAVGEALEAAVISCEGNPDVRAVILTGAGSSAFCAGADLKEVAKGNADGLYTERGGFAGFVHAERSKPWIAALNGIALAGGLEIALACDMIVALRRVELGLPEVSRGLIAAAGGLQRLPAALPRNIALEMIATGRRLGAERAHDLGLVNVLADGDDVLPEAMILAEAIAINSPIAVRESLVLARQALTLPESASRELTRASRRRIMAGPDYREGPRAFLEKRAPRWQT